MDNSRLKRFQIFASIAATIAVPVLIAGFGWTIQSRSADADVQKDYVQMALGILAKPVSDAEADAPLRSWAVEVLSKSSPVPFGAKLESELQAGTAVVLSPFPDQMLNSPLMEAPRKWKPLPVDATNADLIRNYIDNRSEFQVNSIGMSSLQQAVRSMAAIAKGKPVPKREDTPDNSEPGELSPEDYEQMLIFRRLLNGADLPDSRPSLPEGKDEGNQRASQ